MGRGVRCAVGFVLACTATCTGGFSAKRGRSVMVQPTHPLAGGVSSPSSFLTTPTPPTGRGWVRLGATLSSSTSAPPYSPHCRESERAESPTRVRATSTAGVVVADDAARGVRGLGVDSGLPQQVLSEIGLVDQIEQKFYVNLLAYYIAVQQNLTEHLGRKPSINEWALSLNVPAQDLHQDLARSQAVRSSLVENHMKLVRGIAKTYRGRGLSFQDLVQEGVCGVIHAAERFDPARGIMFSTYAKHWIRQFISRAVARHSRMIRLPQRVHERVVTMARVKSDMSVKLGRDPTLQEIAHSASLSPDHVKKYTHISQAVSSLDQTRRSFPGRANRDASATLSLQDVIVDKSHPCPEQHTDRRLLRDELLRLLDQLPELERKVITLRFGLTDGRPKTHEEVFEELTNSEVSSQKCVKLAENRALYKLRKPYKAQKPAASAPPPSEGDKSSADTSQEPLDSSQAQSLRDHQESYNDYVAIYPYNM